MLDKKFLGRRINAARKDKGLTADQLSERCAINATYLRQIEGGGKMPSLPVFIALCNALQVSPTYLLSDALTQGDCDDFDAIAQVWKNATPAQIEMVRAMVKAASAIGEESYV